MEISWNFQLAEIFYLWTKGTYVLSFTYLIQPSNASKNWHLWNKKKTTLSGCISKTRTNLESKLKFSESYSVFFKAMLFSMCSIHMGIQQGVPPAGIIVLGEWGQVPHTSQNFIHPLPPLVDSPHQICNSLPPKVSSPTK